MSLYRKWYGSASNNIYNFIYWIDEDDYFVFELKDGKALHICATITRFIDDDKTIYSWPDMTSDQERTFIKDLFEEYYDMDMLA